jgi:hypothetical protein
MSYELLSFIQFSVNIREINELMPYHAHYQGSWRGVGSWSLGPSTTSAVPMSLIKELAVSESPLGNAYAGPRGAQYCPVFEMSNVEIHSTRDFAATSGVTAEPKLVPTVKR